jgi:raffinose/stachyose/melibiose transport system substrate-binding protein
MKTKSMALASVGALSLMMAMPASAQTLSMLIDNSPNTIATVEALTAAFDRAEPGRHLRDRNASGWRRGRQHRQDASRDRPDDRHLLLQLRLAASRRSMRRRRMLDLTDEPFQANIIDSFKPVVTATDGRIYGVPEEAAMGGGILYNKKIYAELGLSIPKTWAEFMANNEKIKAAGKTAVIQTFGDTWTSQLFVLGDFFNVQAAVPICRRLHGRHRQVCHDARRDGRVPEGRRRVQGRLAQ